MSSVTASSPPAARRHSFVRLYCPRVRHRPIPLNGCELIPVRLVATKTDKSPVHLLVPSVSEDEVPGIETADHVVP